MSLVEDEIDYNCAAFRADWTRQIQANWEALSKDKVYVESYRRISCINAVKTYLLSAFSDESARFFFEAHNDLLVSHVNASYGAWRSALQSLRSCIENALCAFYYKDHPVELRLWQSGEFKIGFADLCKYLERHPNLGDLDSDLTGLSLVRDEYGTLSKAVHGSAVNFRMTSGDSAVLLWNTDKARAAMWATREKRVIAGIVLIFACFFRENLSGTKNTALRQMMSFALSESKRSMLKARLGLSVSAP